MTKLFYILMSALLLAFAIFNTARAINDEKYMYAFLFLGLAATAGAMLTLSIKELKNND